MTEGEKMVWAAAFVASRLKSLARPIRPLQPGALNQAEWYDNMAANAIGDAASAVSCLQEGPRVAREMEFVPEVMKQLNVMLAHPEFGVVVAPCARCSQLPHFGPYHAGPEDSGYTFVHICGEHTQEHKAWSCKEAAEAWNAAQIAEPAQKEGESSEEDDYVCPLVPCEYCCNFPTIEMEDHEWEVRHWCNGRLFRHREPTEDAVVSVWNKHNRKGPG